MCGLIISRAPLQASTSSSCARCALPITNGCERRSQRISRAESRVTHLGRTSFDILGGLIKVLGQAAEHILQVGLPRYLGQSPGMVDFVAVMGCAVHKLKTPRCINYSPAARRPRFSRR